MKKLISLILSALLLTSTVSAIEPVSEDAISIAAPSAILIERSTGEVIYEKNAYEHLSPASVTKVMTMLLVVEAVDSGSLSLDDMVTASARAASMGGSQIWLEEGEQMSVGEMLKCVAVVSANDCCVALAEHLAGSEEAFVARMNERAQQLGMNDTHFTCCSGLLESDGHYSCARDIAVMSRELLGHETIRQYAGVWMDSIRAGEFTLANTNKLIYYYKGATGLKTGFTQKAMYCLSASAMRDGVEFIAVVLHAPSSPERFESAKSLLNYAFANYTLADPSGSGAIPPVEIELGSAGSVQPVMPSGSGFLMEKSFSGGLSYEIDLPEKLKAPISEGQVLGYVRAVSSGSVLSEIPLVASCAVERMSLWQIFTRLLRVTAGADESV
ncbi:MAG: D-alanyl-D-alanine carboxypeptidase [Butyricicoccus sp.]|nr:D-alanyl-D-alanine carboxypeptidase [Butyricicoccus sp.]